MAHVSEMMVTMSDGVELAIRLHRPKGQGPFPTLFAVSPYRFDNDDLPQTKMFLWRETGPIHFYVEQGYAFVRLDVRGTGRSGGHYGFFDQRERRDLYELIEWIAVQSWSNGKVGGIGESYYGTSQWCMAAERPPHLACIAPYDGHVDLYNGWAYTGGVPSEFMSLWWNNNVRAINRRPANGAPERAIPYDVPYHVGLHPTFDEYWEEREFLTQLRNVDIPVFSIGVWAKMDLHLGGNILGWQTTRGPKWLMVTGAANAFEACADFETTAFHEKILLPFYDRFLRNMHNGFEDRAPVEVFSRGAGKYESYQDWPPSQAREAAFFLQDGHSGVVQSLNDGCLSRAPSATAAASTSYDYPQPDWTIGVATLSDAGPDPLRAILTFTSEPLDARLAIAGPCELVVYLSSTAVDTDLIVRVSEMPPADSRKRPAVITKGWLRVSHRMVDEARSRPRAPVLDHRVEHPLVPGQIVECRVPLMHAAYVLEPGARIRIEIANGDSPVTDPIFSHSYTPDKVGRDTIHHSPAHPSRLLLTVKA
jgi:putative CocE/NonD family hydrolase